MSATYIQDGNVVDHMPAADVPLGAVVVLGSLIGIAHRAISAGMLGSLVIEGVIELPIVGAVAPAWSPVFWDPATGTATTDGTVAGVVRCGLLTRPLIATDSTARVLINR